MITRRDIAQRAPFAESREDEEEGQWAAQKRKLAEIESAFRNSGFECESDNAAMRWAFYALGCLWVLQPSVQSSLPQFKKVGRNSARKELDDLADAAEALVARFGALSATAIGALGGPHIVAASAKQVDWLHALAEVARIADVKHVTETVGRGRPKNRRAIYAAGIIIDAFERITKSDADKPANISDERAHDKPRGLEPLVRKIFDVLGIRANAKAMINAALIERAKREQPNSVGKGVLGRRVTSKEFFERMERTEFDKLSPWFWKNNNRPNDN